MNPIYTRQRCFWIVRTDRTETDFSYITCINGKRRSEHDDFRKACRAAIVPQILEFKRRVFATSGVASCELTGRPISWVVSHIDHVIPFEDIVRQFVEEYEVDVASAVCQDSVDQQFHVEFASANIAELWTQYHARVAKLRAVHPRANLSRPRGSVATSQQPIDTTHP